MVGISFFGVGLYKQNKTPNQPTQNLGAGVFITVQGGTGTSTPSGILYGDNGATGSLKTVNIGSNLTFSGGTLSATGGGGSGGGTWSTTTSQVASRLINYPNNTSDIVVVGSNSTTTAEYWLDPNTQRVYLSGRVGIGTTSPETALDVDGVATFGTETDTAPAVIVKGGASGTDLLYLRRTVGAVLTFGWSLAGGGLSFRDVTNGFIIAGMYGDSSVNHLSMGVRGQTTTDTRPDRISAKSFNSGTDVPGTDFQLYGSLGTGAGTPGDIGFYTGTAGASSATTQTGTVRATIKGNTGNFGIGTTSPYAKLSVVGEVVGSYFSATSTVSTSTFAGFITSQRAHFSGSATNTAAQGWNITNGCFAVNGTCIGGGSGSGTVGSGTTGQVPYYAGAGTTLTATSTLFLTTGSNVGIGTTTPTAKLVVTGNGSSAITFGDAGFANCSSIKLGDTSVITTTNYHLTSCGADQALYINTPTGRGIFFRQNNADVMTLTSGQNFGIGTTSPYAKLAVVGEAVASYFTATSSTASRFVGGYTAGNTLVLTSFTPSGVGAFAVQTENNTFADTDGNTTLSLQGNRESGTFTGSFGPSTLQLSLVDSTNSFNFVGGNVGIGTSTPYAPLSVIGQAVASYFTATSTTATSSFQDVTVQGKPITGYRYMRLGYSTTTTWTGSTTAQLLGLAGLPQTFDQLTCDTTVGTLNVQITNNSSDMNMTFASATPSTYTLSSNNALALNDSTSIVFGTPASSPVSVSCVLRYYLNNDQ